MIKDKQTVYLISYDSLSDKHKAEFEGCVDNPQLFNYFVYEGRPYLYQDFGFQTKQGYPFMADSFFSGIVILDEEWEEEGNFKLTVATYTY